MKVLVCGGRDYGNVYEERSLIWETLDDLLDLAGVVFTITGGAKGADEMAAYWSVHTDMPHLVFMADWDAHGRAAGPIRNKQMLEEGKPDLVLAFPGGKGTADMIRQAEAAGVEVRRVGNE